MFNSRVKSLFFLFAVTFMVVFGSLAQAAVVDLYWDNGGDGVSWSDGLNWTGDVVPQNTATDQYNANINGYSVIVGSGSGTCEINALSLDAASSLTINSGYNLVLNADSLNYGLITLNDASSSTYNYSQLTIKGTVQVGNSSAVAGAIEFGNVYHNQIRGDGTDDLLILGANQTVRTSAAGTKGTISVDVANHGLIHAMHSGGGYYAEFH